MDGGFPASDAATNIVPSMTAGMAVMKTVLDQ